MIRSGAQCTHVFAQEQQQHERKARKVWSLVLHRVGGCPDVTAEAIFMLVKTATSRTIPGRRHGR